MTTTKCQGLISYFLINFQLVSFQIYNNSLQLINSKHLLTVYPKHISIQLIFWIPLNFYIWFNLVPRIEIALTNKRSKGRPMFKWSRTNGGLVGRGKFRKKPKKQMMFEWCPPGGGWLKEVIPLFKFLWWFGYL